MADVENFFKLISLSLIKYEDPRTKDWFLVQSFSPVLIICLVYLFIVKILVPKLVEKRKPVELKKTLIVYNFFQIGFSCWLFYGFASNGWLSGDYSFVCQPIDVSSTPKAMQMAAFTWWYYMSKLTELVETIFFILRKKFKQVNFLHVYHHTIMIVSGYVATKYYPTGHGTFAGLVNTFIHIVMYSYYLLSAFGPNVQKYLWWKKYITTLQLVQFVIVTTHDLLLVTSHCQFPRIFAWYMILLSLSFYVLFRNFYNQTYREKRVEKDY
ncbi:very long chain fatty acid elongase AAEL008004-like [Zophobas morio]|uniref:very long chain fatty acid elongase AAEL008004-like n=1 Tax=Zophobas morio TaxID=2755281 RepID=UPI003083DEE4